MDKGQTGQISELKGFSMIGYLGSILMVCFSFTLFIPLAVSGLILLTFQAFKLRAWNLVALNIISAAGFACQLF